jgi:pimeloyl-ACP methyl ester carboxylesterase
MASPKPFKLNISQERLDKLQQKLALTDLPDELEDSGWDYGIPLADIKRLTAYWQNGFDWPKTQERLNELPQYTISIDIDGFETLEIHFVYQKSDVSGAIPLLFCHGWPGSFIEVAKILPELVKGSENHPAFHVVSPSLANFGFSQGTKKVSSEVVPALF